MAVARSFLEIFQLSKNKETLPCGKMDEPGW